MKLNKEVKKVVICSHVYAFGTSQALHLFLQRQKVHSLFIGQNLEGTPITWLWGIIKSFLTILISWKRYDLFVGSNCLNAMLGLFCRFLGIVDKVVFFSPDYVQKRFDAKYLNFIYRFMDHFCVKHCDLTWNSSTICNPDPMMLARETEGLSVNYRYKQMQNPDGTDDKISLGIKNRKNLKIGFIGHLREGMGALNLLNAFERLEREILGCELILIGSGPLEQKVKDKSKMMNGVSFRGYVGDIEEVYEILSECSIAAAPYEAGSISQYTDPGKLKVYLSLGLPIVVNDVPLFAQEIHKHRAGLSVDPSNNDNFYNALKKLLMDKEMQKECTANAVLLAKKYHWDNIFTRSINSIYDPNLKNYDLFHFMEK